ncbi:hypothetical protein FNJ84_17620 [Paracoccus sp. M683]|uniref:hypothetical protein n=1 Tax=Paracoccus sp. M683 TaxID=2594268 RepID=UPI00118136D3|nr:hypothetical protein [Paracoccus sp. M683]TRW95106.1 hypothetical protein FNJ84_17620 [Paracoccus sp. M683]
MRWPRLKPTFISPIIAALAQAACVKPAPPEPVGTRDGKPVYQIFTSMQATEKPTEAQLARMSAQLQGTGRGNLAERASAQCPSGHDIVGQTQPEASFSMTMANGTPLYRVGQTFEISCR